MPREGVAEVKTYRVVYERDESGHWIATIPAVKGCHSYGRSINEARAGVREALGLFVRGAGRARLVDEVRLPADARDLLKKLKGARARAEREQAQAVKATRDAARLLARGIGLSVRDTGDLVGLSHQRVHQLLAER